ncbi:hypothetical protein SAMN02745751_03404 [Dethiosulfatibacter aminovorans DSM 17477]|uniref:Uncharacterized protein n=1 Tax=Dethiosulfatibacter aminovorans DSM 17477 TaxID=1121476 RepID=A0A1M6M9A6_9FIRM|nr:hypothetical protein [Dethiosulfatibacter aminovorans]SHJ80002.1 hypothetical protein SAMN02745751_03404 [Dethiosulfatibacter aminovorans DSM 17477]
MTINDVIAMKQEKNVPFGNQYRWLILTIENDLISKTDGENRVRQLLAEYDYEARLFIVHQFFHIGENQLGNELFSVLDLDPEKTILEDKHINELVDGSVL